MADEEYIRAAVYAKLCKRVGKKQKVKRRGIIERLLFRKYIWIVDPLLLSKCCNHVEYAIQYNRYIGVKIDLDKIIDRVIDTEVALL